VREKKNFFGAYGYISLRTLKSQALMPSVDTKIPRVTEIWTQIKNRARHIFEQAKIAQQHFFLDVFVVSLF
jgi:hypothetical protein